MPSDLSSEITAVATAVLAAFAIVTAVFAMHAFRKQSQEVRTIERQVKDQEALTRQQAELLTIQSAQLTVSYNVSSSTTSAQNSDVLKPPGSSSPPSPAPDPDTSAAEPIRETFVTVTKT
jgi:hypothetical protein